jgi:hypothetical protein
MRSARRSGIAALLASLAMGKNQHPVSKSVKQKPFLFQTDGYAYTVINNLFFLPLEGEPACR